MAATQAPALELPLLISQCILDPNRRLYLMMYWDFEMLATETSRRFFGSFREHCHALFRSSLTPPEIRFAITLVTRDHKENMSWHPCGVVESEIIFCQHCKSAAFAVVLLDCRNAPSESFTCVSIPANINQQKRCKSNDVKAAWLLNAISTP